MKTTLQASILTLSLLILFSCKEKPPVAYKNLKVIFINSSLSLFKDSGELTDSGMILFDESENTDEKCKYTFVLNPNLIRPDLKLEHSITTKIEKSGVSNVNNPNVVAKLVKKNLQELKIPESFFQKSTNKSDSLFNIYLSTELAASDSIIIFSTSKSDSIEVNKKIYKSYTDINEVKAKIISISCQDPKANFVLLIDPPVSTVQSKLTITSIEQDCQKRQLIVKTSGGDGTSITYSAQGLSAGTNSNVFLLSKDQSNGKAFTFIAKQGNSTPSKFYTTNCTTTPGPHIPHDGGKIRRSNGLPPVGNLTIIKGTEGCEVCTRYYSAVDATGRMHEIRERNSTNCCPCNKTIEMRGRTYLMNCDGNPRLELVD
jgi:hypothetical protein